LPRLPHVPLYPYTTLFRSFPPNIRPQPSSMKPRDDTAKTIKFLDRMLTVFLARATPASTAAKPRFMKNTRIAASSTHKVATVEIVSISDPCLNRRRAGPAAPAVIFLPPVRGRVQQERGRSCLASSPRGTRRFADGLW